MITKASFSVCVLVLAFSGAAFSQTTIFNIPAADTLQKSSVNVEADFLTHPVSYRNGGYQTYGYRLAYGVTSKTEIGSNFYLTWDGHHSVADIEFSFKREIYRNEKHGVLSSIGVTAFVPLRPATGDRTAFMVYGNAAKTIKKTGGTQLTGGVYHVFRGDRNFGTRTGALFAFVQPIRKRLTGVIDWFSGDNRFGYLSTGFTFYVTKRQYLTAGYSFGNSGRGNNALAVYYGIIY
ncbi:MAG: hypothetical protein JO314_10360 [Acidobacteria bacterium]|nr:hypothetical protein [Acidobacteriota bacterium]